MQQLEIEYKILLTHQIFNQILEDYHDAITKDYIQTNDYFTHPLLSQKKYMLRIRTKNNQYELTLKRPYQNHQLETNIPLTKKEKDLFFARRTGERQYIQIAQPTFNRDVCQYNPQSYGTDKEV